MIEREKQCLTETEIKLVKETEKKRLNNTAVAILILPSLVVLQYSVHKLQQVFSSNAIFMREMVYYSEQSLHHQN